MPPPRRAERRRERWSLALTLALLLLAAIPPLINLGRFQHRIAGSVSRSIGRPIAFRSLSFHLLPWPALEFQDFAVDEDPRFGFEPALLAPIVTATPRFSSLWRGRFELARVELTNPSVNLVRNPDGRWSVGALLLQASRATDAPTGQHRPGPAPRFPYITATGARINLKRGAEKLPYSLLDADFSMSLASPEAYRLKLEGRPVRTDITLSANDTGTLRIEGDLHRATAFGAMPLDLAAEWKEASLGQLSELLVAQDWGWRALIDASAHLSGDLDHLAIRTRIVAANLHRQEFTPERAYTIDARCQSFYSRAQPLSDSLRCRWPLGAGALTLESPAQAALPPAQTPTTQPPDRIWNLTLDRIPADVLAATLGLLRENVPAPGRFGGELTGVFTWQPAAGALTGSAAMPRLTLSGAAPGGSPLSAENLVLAAAANPAGDRAGNPGAQLPARSIAPRPGRSRSVAEQASPPQLELTLSADPLDFQAPNRPLTLSARLSPRGWAASAAGSAALPSLQALAAALRIPSLDRLSPKDNAGKPELQLALAFSGDWLAGAPSISGSLSAANIAWQPAWLPFPIELASASATLASGILRWDLHSVDAGPLHLSGAAQTPLACDAPAPCITRFTLATPAIDAAALQSALTGSRPELVEELLHRFQSRARLPAFLGSIHAGTLLLGPLPIHDAEASISSGLDPSLPASIDIHSLSGNALGGALELQGALSLAGALPAYRLHAALARVSLPDAGALFNESWPAGTLSGSADFTLSGASAGSLAASIAGSWQAAWLNGAVGRSFTAWDASGSLNSSGLAIDRGALTPSGEAVSGAIDWDRTLRLRLSPSPDGPPSEVTGTLAHPTLQTR